MEESEFKPNPKWSNGHVVAVTGASGAVAAASGLSAAMIMHGGWDDYLFKRVQGLGPRLALNLASGAALGGVGWLSFEIAKGGYQELKDRKRQSWQEQVSAEKPESIAVSLGR
jgi:hypothetical protein